MTDERAVPTSSRVLHVPVDGELCEADVLRVWEELGQEVACALTGAPGLFPGYDDLEWHLAASGGRDVLVSARAVEVLERRHVVDFEATLVLDSGDGAHPEGPSLAHGRGLSLVLTDRPFADPRP